MAMFTLRITSLCLVSILLCPPGLVDSCEKDEVVTMNLSPASLEGRLMAENQD